MSRFILGEKINIINDLIQKTATNPRYKSESFETLQNEESIN